MRLTVEFRKLAKDGLCFLQRCAHAAQNETRLTVRLELEFMVAAIELDMKQEKVSELMRQHGNQRPVVAGVLSDLTHKGRIVKDVTLPALDKGFRVVGVLAGSDQDAIIDRGETSGVEQLSKKIPSLVVRFEAAEDACTEPVEAANAGGVMFARALGKCTRVCCYNKDGKKKQMPPT
jgi:hypothetical protein